MNLEEAIVFPCSSCMNFFAMFYNEIRQGGHKNQGFNSNKIHATFKQQFLNVLLRKGNQSHHVCA